MTRAAVSARRPKVSEHDVQRQIIEWLRWSGWLVLRINSGATLHEATVTSARRFVRFVDAGDPMLAVSDVLAFKDGMLLAVEVKRPGWRPPTEPPRGAPVSATAKWIAYQRQEAFLYRVRVEGGVGVFATCIDDVQDALSRDGKETA